MEIDKKIIVKVKVCDYCKKELDRRFPDRCAVCGKDLCEVHIAQCEEDGSICLECNKKGYKIKYYNDGGVGVIKNGKRAEGAYL